MMVVRYATRTEIDAAEKRAAEVLAETERLNAQPAKALPARRVKAAAPAEPLPPLDAATLRGVRALAEGEARVAKVGAVRTFTNPNDLLRNR